MCEILVLREEYRLFQANTSRISFFGKQSRVILKAAH